MLVASSIGWFSPAARLLASSTTSLASRSFASSAIARAGYKLKSHQGAKKRWHAIASGKFKRVRCPFMVVDESAYVDLWLLFCRHKQATII